VSTTNDEERTTNAAPTGAAMRIRLRRAFEGFVRDTRHRRTRSANQRHFPDAFQFYTQILDFEYVEGDDPANAKEAAFCVLSREGDQIFLSNFDGGTRSVIVIMTDDVDGVFRKFRARGLHTPRDPNVPAEEVHQGPLNQTWGTREFYVEDPDGNSLRFTQVV
jgi:catechol 2,3-dioxygenase-like lactoylglutathione lyase family enzyme